MKNVITMLLSLCVGLFLYSTGYSQSHELADKYWDKAQKLRKEGQYLEAARMYVRSAEAEKKSPAPRQEDLSAELYWAGDCFRKADQYDKAIEYYEESLAIDRKLGKYGEVAIKLNNIGYVYKAWGQYDKAIKYYKVSLAIDRKLGREGKIAISLNNIGEVYRAWGQYDKAIKYFKEALAIDRKLGREADIATALNNIGLVYYAWGQYDKAIKYFKEALAINRKLGKQDQVAIQLNNIGMVYNAWGQYDKAIKYYEESLAIDRRLGKEGSIATALNNIGMVYKAWGQYDKAIKYFEEALAIDRRLGGEADIAISLNNIGSVYDAWGQYDKAIKYFEEALAINRKLGKEDQIAFQLNNIGSVYHDWGQYDKAIKYYEEALAIDRKLGKEAEIARDLNNIGSVYHDWGQYDKAIKYFEESLAINRKLGKEGSIAVDLNNIGLVYEAWGQYNKAIKYFEESLAIDRRLGGEGSIAVDLNNIGRVYYAWGQYDKAIKYFEEALAIDRRLGREADIARDLNNIGVFYYDLKKYDKAIKNFEASVDLKENLRKTATGDVRRDYLASQIGTYQFLTSAFLLKGDLHKAFATIELSRAKLLAERLAGSESKITLPSVKQIQENLPEDTAILVYGNVKENWDVVQIVITKDSIHGAEVPDDEFMTSTLKKHEPFVKTMLKNQAEISVVAKKDKQDQKRAKYKSGIEFADILNYYRTLLTNPTSQSNRVIQVVQKDDAAIKSNDQSLDRMLYNFLIKPLGKHIKDEKSLIIVPDGILGYLPFETLVDQNGNYLVENYNISYTQSMGVLDLIKKRKYAASRSPMLAFGGAVYDEVKYAADMIENEKQLENLQKNVYASLENRGSVREAYAKLALTKWPNLPGTLSEIKNIKKVVRGAKIYKGDKATETKVKDLSKKGDLAKYKVIHFATHAVVVPAIPELSAVVLSQFKKAKGNEDGYLLMGEIAQLKIEADFVNLSACDTGLGKIYGGEGVVGLSQSFLVAGANGLSVSLWEVADESTSQFMVALYKLVEEKGLGYDDAVNEIKRRFIRGEFGAEYRAPYYWAPFVYYGI